MKELIIHKWWISNDMQAFTTIDDKLIKVIEPGKYNLHDGPIFRYYYRSRWYQIDWKYRDTYL